MRIPSSSEITGIGKALTREDVSVGSKTLDCIASVVISDFYSNAAAGVTENNGVKSLPRDCLNTRSFERQYQDVKGWFLRRGNNLYEAVDGLTRMPLASRLSLCDCPSSVSY